MEEWVFDVEILSNEELFERQLFADMDKARTFLRKRFAELAIDFRDAEDLKLEWKYDKFSIEAPKEDDEVTGRIIVRTIIK